MPDEENRPAGDEDVEGHIFADRPPVVAEGQDDEEPDVEAHGHADGVADGVAENVSETVAD